MAKPLYPPSGYECSYRNTCPHMDGLSTMWVYGEYRRANDVYLEHLRIIDNLTQCVKTRDKRITLLERENAEIRAKFIALHQRQFKPNKKTAAETGGEIAEDARLPERKAKKRGAPVGHPGWSRPIPPRIDRTIPVAAPTICPHCQSGDLTPVEELNEHIQEDIELRPKTVVTCYQHEMVFCERCKRTVVQAGDGELLNAQIGPVAKSTAVYLRYTMGLSYRKVKVLFRDLFGLNFVPASAVGFDRKAAKQGAPIYEDLREKIRASKVVHADETSWRNEGIGHFVWFAGNVDLAFFHIDRHRSQDVAKSIFGEDFQGTLVRDRYAAYNGIGKEWQSCWAHINTKAKEIGQQHGLLPEEQKDSSVTSFVERLRQLCSEVCEAGQKLKTGEFPWEQTAKLEKQFSNKLKIICKSPLGFGPAETLRSYLIGPERKSLFTFLRHEGVPPTNNHAEQSLRFMVIFRKILFGNRSERGLLTHSILPSLLQTAIRQRVSPRKFLEILFTAGPDSAQAALYQNSG